LSALRGPAFDREYASNELAYHQTVNGAVAQTLIPSARNPQLKSLLENAAPIFQQHEQHAKRWSKTSTRPGRRTAT